VKSNKQPQISVCMASYNGERYIAEQLESILSQLSAEDELIIVDDASTDQTREQIAATSDPRVRLLVNEKNLGVLASFEKALSNSSGEIVFFSDQDDVWKPEKVSTILGVFGRIPDAMLVLSDSTVIDENDRVIADSYYLTRTKFTTGILANILYFRYQGCSMALRRTLLPDVLPFPAFYTFHDIWIGMKTHLAGHKILYINQPLFLYRRHSLNVSHTLSKSRQIKVRVHLVAALLLDGIRRAFASLRCHS
jgi:glycosyltransferase involved in cell wall biosynthesis